MTTRYKTKQGELILNKIKECQGSIISPSQLVAILIPQKISKTTIYRQLAKLKNDNQICRIVLENGEVGYTLKENPKKQHYHLICEDCGKVEFLICNTLAETQDHLLEEHGFLINNKHINLYGLCECCQKNGGTL